MADQLSTEPDTVQQCAKCGVQVALLDARTLCANCGGLLEIAFRSPPAPAAELRKRFASRVTIGGPSAPAERSGVWRYREMLPAFDTEHVVTYPEGNTPLLSRRGIADWAGVANLVVKHEGLNPTGSFKDRGMSVAISQARRIGATTVACASTGNTSSSLAAYAGIAGLSALVFVPSGFVSEGKLSQTLAYGARTLLVRGDFDACLRLAREASEKLGVYLVNSVNAFRIEGQKTIVLELLHQLNWDAPDWIALPAGNLGNAAAFGKAIREAKEYGLISKVPRVLLVQAGGAAPFVRSFREGFATRYRVQANTIASAIRIGDPASFDRAVRTVRETDGIVVDVSDDEIIEAKAVVDASGVGCEPASAASVAGVRKLAADGTISRDATVVAVLTGHLLKDTLVKGTASQGVNDARPHEGGPVEIAPTLHAVEKALADMVA